MGGVLTKVNGDATTVGVACFQYFGACVMTLNWTRQDQGVADEEVFCWGRGIGTSARVSALNDEGLSYPGGGNSIKALP